MKQSKGFTLIEMLAVLVIIILLTSAIVPSLINLIARNKNKLSNQTKDLIYSATELYLSENNNYSKLENNTYCISISTLVNDGKLNSPIKDFKTGKEVNLSNVVEAKVNKYSEFEYSIKEEKKCTEKRGYSENILNGSDPKLLDNMIPVIYDNGSWKKATTDEKWYSYEEYMWANAVTVSDSKYYTLESGTVIEENDINGFYVWIPRFEYKKVDSTTPKKFQLDFISSNKTTPSRGYTISDAFKFDSENLSGVWISKFEAKSDDSKTLCSQVKSEGTCNVNTNNAIFTNTKSSWTNISLSVAYSVISKMNISGNIYGFSQTESDTHLLKNSEWEIVTYLTMSDYGKFSNTNYSSKDKEVTIASTSYNYKESLSSTTTGNIYGIYDMSGNNDEFVMANINNNIASSAFKEMPSSIYYDKVDENSFVQTKNWYNDTSIIPSEEQPWLLRGGNSSDGDLAGIFAHKSSDGSPNEAISFRAAIIKK